MSSKIMRQLIESLERDLIRDYTNEETHRFLQNTKYFAPFNLEVDEVDIYDNIFSIYIPRSKWGEWSWNPAEDKERMETDIRNAMGVSYVKFIGVDLSSANDGISVKFVVEE